MKTRACVGVTMLLALLACASEETRAWQDARAAESIQGFSRFLERFPASRHAQQARREVERLSWDAANAANGLAGYVKFAGDFPQSQKAEDAKTRIRQMTAAEIDRAFLLAVNSRFDSAANVLKSVVEAAVRDPVALNNYAVLLAYETQRPDRMNEVIAILEDARSFAGAVVVGPLTGAVNTELIRVVGQPPFELNMYLYADTTVSLRPWDFEKYPEVFVVKEDVLVTTVDSAWGTHVSVGVGYDLVTEIENNLRKARALLEYKSKEVS
jgi:hypothetical protein